ncbi:hypothetical protein [Paucisalibacillus sp. EB02]|uniref:hypothetical protein n=1 Tax=Paucisalibacillus sp. EB02 TaxID=1347087 RepID=UPI0004B0B5AD|nr:hypothetical protein [Paucisalibacillus sp. EB02]
MIEENISYHESNNYYFGPSMFSFYNENGLEIETNNTVTFENTTFGHTLNLRPGGKNEGTMIIPIAKDEKI